MRYTDEQKAAAVATYIEAGGAEAARQHGMTSRAILNWAKAAGVSKERTKNLEAASAMFTLEREAIRTKLVSRLDDMLTRMDTEASSADVKNYAISFGILLDKMRLELGEVTGRTETVEIGAAVSRVDQEIERLTRNLDDIHP